ncbi:methyl-accepting chemotaxis protein [Candidatus Lokiarchaeum ossiferum]|uniref:methyl-accepting chemotaxis protein n=1 Tax=Candidatus Lokiarchaeum ossiferum TaxID=2951803 RepID=UPI00352DBB88
MKISSTRIIKNCPTGMMVVDKDFTIQSLNAHFEDFTGFHLKDSIGKKCHDLFKKDFCLSEDCPVICAKKTLKASPIVEIEHYNTQTRENKKLQVCGAPILSEHGKLIGAMETFIDVTRASSLTDSIFEGSPMAFMVTDMDFKIIKLNKAFEKYTGFPVNSSIGSKCYNLFKQEFCRTDECPITQAKRFKRMTEPVNIPINLPNGEKKVLQVSGAPVFDVNGELVGAMETFLDVTKVRRLIESVDHLAGDVSTMATQIAESSNQINVSIQEVTGGTQEVAKGAMHQSQSIGEISEAVMKVQKMSSDIVSNSTFLANKSELGQTMAQKGNDLTDDLVIQINEVTKGAKKVSIVMASLENKSKEINKIVDTISGIATETNLLALNAAIEAARAGDAGKGFAVVAEQVRKLAEDSKVAADQIGDLIQLIQNEVGEAVAATNSTVESIQNGELALKGTKSQLDSLFQIINETNMGILKTIEQVNHQDIDINQIATNTENINSVIEESSSTTEELSSSTQEMASTLEELSAAAEELNSTADRLFEEVKKI